MKTMPRVSYLERLFTRSRLETSVALAQMPRLMSVAGKSSSGRTHTQLHQLKRQLLRAALEATPQAHLFKRLCGAANQAAELSWNTSHPLLVFPCLFDELIAVARQTPPAPSPSATPVSEFTDELTLSEPSLAASPA